MRTCACPILLFALLTCSLSPVPARADDEAKELQRILEELENEVSDLRPQRGGRGAAAHFKFVNSAAAQEGKGVLDKAISNDASLLAGADKVELVKVFDAAAQPMRHHAGDAEELDDAYSNKALVGTSHAIMLWGPYAELEPGRHLVVYRFKFLDEVEGKQVCFLDVCHKAVTFSGRRPGAKEVPSGKWNEIAIPVDVPNPMQFEFRMWPQNHRVAIDRIYVYRLSNHIDIGPDRPISIMGAVERTGFYRKQQRDNSVARLIDAAGGGNNLADPERFSLWRRRSGEIEKVELHKNDTRKKTKVQPGDIILVPEK